MIGRPTDQPWPFLRSPEKRVCFDQYFLTPATSSLSSQPQVENYTALFCYCVPQGCHRLMVTRAPENKTVNDSLYFVDTPPPFHQDPKPVPVPAHLIPLPDSRPPTPELKDSPPEQSLSNASSLRNTGTKDEGAIDTMRDSEKKVEHVGSLSSSPNIRRIIEPLPWSRPPRFSVKNGEAIVNERLRKAFCAEIGCPLVPLRSHIIPTPASFGETRESLDARRAELKSAGYR